MTLEDLIEQLQALLRHSQAGDGSDLDVVVEGKRNVNEMPTDAHSGCVYLWFLTRRQAANARRRSASFEAALRSDRER